MNPETKKVISDPQDTLLRGVDTLANAVSSTLGPLGNNVIIETPYGATTVTKDGVTVAKFIELEDPIENLGAQLIKQAAARTSHNAGDGTTTSTLIAQTLAKEARKLTIAGVPPIKIKRELERLLAETLNLIKDYAKPVSDENIQEIATISANNDEHIGALIAEAFRHVTKDGVVVLEESSTGTTYLHLSDGVQIQRGFVSPFFVTDAAKKEAVLENPFILITDKKLRYTQELIPILDKVAAQNKPLLIIADEIDSQALQLLVVNKMRGNIQVAAIRAPSFGDHRLEELEDLAALTSGTLLLESSATRLEDTTLDQLGRAQKVIVTKDHTILLEPTYDEDRINKRVEHIQNLIQLETSEYLKQKYNKRLASIRGKAAVIKVGASTETELKETKDRIDDALRATSAAIEKGYIVGGGTALARIAEHLSLTNNSIIFPIFYAALTAPLKKIASNAGVSPDLILSTVLQDSNFNFGYNALKAQFEDLVSAGVIDPALVLDQALKNAVSAANMILLSSTAIHYVSREPRYSPGQMPEYDN